MVSRTDHRVHLEILPDKTKSTLQRIIKSHLDLGGTVISDEHASYGGLDNDGYDYKSVKKEKIGKHAYPLSYDAETTSGRVISVHTNTTEGLWSELRAWLHAAHGYTADTMYYVLAEFMYHHMGVDFLVAFQQ